jgi:outer membrane receptor for ferrienterochelin and colicins
LKKAFFISILFILTANLFSQSLKRVLLVVDQQNSPLMGIKIDLIEKDQLGNDLSKTTKTTDNNGQITTNSTNDIYLTLSAEFGEISNLINPWKAQMEELTVIVTTDINRINPVSITGSLTPKAATQNPYSVEVITQKTIAAMGAQTLNDVLQNQSNIQLSQDPILGNSIQLQGLSGQNVKILINGVPMIGRLNGNLDISQIPLSNVERIEVIEGPMSVVYGSDAIGGVVNIITKKPIKNTNKIQLNNFMDGVGNVNNDINFQLGGLAKNGGIGITGDIGRQFYEGTDFNPTTRSFDWKPKTKLFGSLGMSYNLKKSSHTLKTTYFNEKLTDRTDAEYNLITVTGYNNYFYTNRIDFLLLSDFTLNKSNKLQFQNSYNIYSRTKTMVRRDLVEGIETITRPADQDTTINQQINLRGLWSKMSSNKKFDWLTGYEFQYESIKTLRVSQKDGIYDFAIFTTVDYSPSTKLQIKPSLRFIYNNQFGKNPFPEFLGNGFKLAPVIPSLQIKYNASKYLIFRGSYARGFRAPTLKELYFLFVDINHNVQGNQSLGTETAHNFIGSMDYRHIIGKNAAATFKLSYFKNFITNQIQLALLDNRTNLYQYINVGKMNSQGITTQTEYFRNQFQFKVSASWINNQSKSDNTGNWKIWDVVQTSFNVSYKIKQPGISVQIFSRYTGQNYGFEENGKAFEIAPYYLADLSLNKTFFNDKLDIQLGCKNVMDVKQIQSSATSGAVHGGGSGNMNISAGRNFFVQCRLTL